MVDGNEYIFDNIVQAMDYVLQNEQKALAADGFRQTPPLVVSYYGSYPVPVDSLDYPLTAFYNNVGDDKFIMTRLLSGRYSLKPDLKNRKYLFRGESEFHSPCRPTVSRNIKQKRYTAEMARGQEMMLLLLSHPLVQLLDMGVELKGEKYRFEMNLYGLTQHYYNKTTFIDLTSDIEVASFFATSKYDPNSDMYDALENQEASGVLYYYSIDVNKAFGVDGNPMPRLSTIGLQVFPRSGRQKGFLYDVTPQEDFNQTARLHAVLFKHDSAMVQRINDQFHGGKDLFPDDILQNHWRTYNFDPKVISNRTVIANKIHNPKMSLKQVEDELFSLGFTIKEYQPQFTEEELEEYYDAIKYHNFWTDFCSQIHIPGDANGEMMSELLDLPNNPLYKWAFERDDAYVTDPKEGWIMSKYEKCLW